MSLHYLLDGYNIINQVPPWNLEKLEDRRNKLIHWVETSHPQGSSSNSVTVVFDGRSGIWSRPVASVVKTIFSVEETADERIKRIVAEAENKKSIVVITDDKEIKFAVRAMGARVMSVKEFLSGSEKKGKASSETKTIPETLQHAINKELKEIWLKNKKNV